MEKGQRNRNHSSDVSPRRATPERTRPANVRGGASQRKGATTRLEDDTPSLVSWAPGSRIDPSVAPSIRGKKPPTVVEASAVLFWIKNCVQQWKLVNAQIERALADRKHKAKNEVRCAALAVVQKQGCVTELQLSLDKAQQQQRAVLIHHHLDSISDAFRDTQVPYLTVGSPLTRADLKGELKEKAEILKQAIVAALEQIPLTDGALIGEEGGATGLESLNQCLEAAQASLQQFSRLLSKFIAPLSRTPCSNRSLSPQRGTHLLTTPLQRMEATAKLGKQLEAVAREEVELMREIAALVEMKHRKQLQLNSMKAYRAQLHTQR